MKLEDAEETLKKSNFGDKSSKEETLAAPTYDVTQQNDFGGLGDLTKGSNMAKLAMTMKTFEFADNVTMHGLRYIFMRNISQTRRLLWLLIVLGGTAYCSYLFYQTVNSYFEHPTVTKVSTNYEIKSEFPAITICNYNVFTKSKLTEAEQAILGHVYANGPLPEGLNLSDFDSVDIERFYKEKGFDYQFGICIHKGIHCKKELLSHHVTDFGVCLTFDPGNDKDSKYQTTSGKAGGFYYGNTFKRNEWTLGPHYTYEGFRILIHKSGSVPRVLLDNGVSALPGLMSEISVSRKEATILPPPHGQCGTKKLDYFDEYAYDDCMLECETKHMVSECGCRNIYLPGTAPECTFQQALECGKSMTIYVNDSNIFDASKCECPQDCVSTSFVYHVTHSKPAEGYNDIVKQIYNMDISEGVGVQIYYRDLMYTKEVEEPVYTVEKLLCDIGGATGLFLGCSFVTFVEFLDFLVEFAWFWGTKGAIITRKNSNQIDTII